MNNLDPVKFTSINTFARLIKRAKIRASRRPIKFAPFAINEATEIAFTIKHLKSRGHSIPVYCAAPPSRIVNQSNEVGVFIVLGTKTAVT